MNKEIYRAWLHDYCHGHSDPIVKESQELLRHCLSIDGFIPNEYAWRYSSVESLKKQLESAKGYKGFNSVYWKDQARNIEAYAVMTLWRGLELIKSCLRGLNEKETINPAILARSLLELSACFLLNANDIEKTFEAIEFPKSTLVSSEAVEEMVVKMIWGTRYGNPADHLKQKNILTSLQRLSKNPNASKLMPTYEFLCDVAHPSFIGNTAYWSHVEQEYEDGSEKRIISRLSSREFNDEIIGNTVWALAWSSSCIRNSFEIMNNANRGLIRKLEIS